MSEVSSYYGFVPHRSVLGPDRAPRHQASDAERVERDRVELSIASSSDEYTGNGVTISAARIEEVRAQIAGDAYLTDEKLDAAVGQLLDVLREMARG